MMDQTKMHPIELEFLARGVVRGSSLLMLRPQDAIDLVRVCRERQVPVSDVEGFRVYPNGGTQPFMDHSLGLGRASRDVDDPDNCWSMAERFLLDHVSSDFFFCVTLPIPGVDD